MYDVKPEVLTAIHDERVFQNRKWGTIQDHPHEVGGYLTIMRKLLADADQAWSSNKGDYGALVVDYFYSWSPSRSIASSVYPGILDLCGEVHCLGHGRLLMTKLTLTIAAVVLLSGCVNPPRRAWEPTKTKWIHTVESIETYDRCVRDADGKVIIIVMHATSRDTDTYEVFEDGAGYGEYLTRNQAKLAAAKRHPECTEEQQ